MGVRCGSRSLRARLRTHHGSGSPEVIRDIGEVRRTRAGFPLVHEEGGQEGAWCLGLCFLEAEGALEFVLMKSRFVWFTSRPGQCCPIELQSRPQVQFLMF